MWLTHRPWLALVGFIVLCEAAGLAGTAFTMSAIPEWYAFLAKPEFSPPNWLFGPVWTLLYFMMGVAAWLVWRRAGAVALKVFWLQLALNALWTPLFFGLRSPLLGFVCIAALWLAIVWTIAVFWRVSRPAAVLLLPYLAWVSFASILNLSIYMLN